MLNYPHPVTRQKERVLKAMGGFLSLVTDKGEFNLLGNPGAIQIHQANNATIKLVDSASAEKTIRAASFSGTLRVERGGEDVAPDRLAGLRVGDKLAIRVDGGGDENWDLGTIRDIP